MDMSPGARCMMTGLRSHLAAASCKVSGMVAVNNNTCNGTATVMALSHLHQGSELYGMALRKGWL